MIDYNVPRSPIDWKTIAKDGYPTPEEFGAYPFVLVALSCEGYPEGGKRIQLAELRFFGRDRSRPYWVGCTDSKKLPIENGSWYVTHWAPYPADPID